MVTNVTSFNIVLMLLKFRVSAKTEHRIGGVRKSLDLKALLSSSSGSPCSSLVYEDGFNLEVHLPTWLKPVTSQHCTSQIWGMMG